MHCLCRDETIFNFFIYYIVAVVNDTHLSLQWFSFSRCLVITAEVPDSQRPQGMGLIGSS